MPRGGARPNSGPAPSLGALERVRDGKEWTRLPKHGLREGEVPEWPPHMAPEAPSWPSAAKDDAQQRQRDYEMLRWTAEREREAAYWQRLWATQPQAHVWRADGTEDIVAMYARSVIEASEPGATATSRTLVKQLASDLLLNTGALHSARYIIDREMEGEVAFPDAGAQPAVATGTDGGSVRSIRDGLTIVPLVSNDDDDDE